MDPFNRTDNERLHNIATGKKLSLMKYLGTFAVLETPENVHKTIIDAIFFGVLK